ncbi:hypothetical protein PENTCL1PPCAC_8608, partial [Pristionchus entomophagus]
SNLSRFQSYGMRITVASYHCRHNGPFFRVKLESYVEEVTEMEMTFIRDGLRLYLPRSINLHLQEIYEVRSSVLHSPELILLASTRHLVNDSGVHGSTVTCKSFTFA